MSALVDRVMMSPAVLCRWWTCCWGFRRISISCRMACCQREGTTPHPYFCQREGTTPHPYLWQRCPYTHTHTPAILIKHTHTHTCSDLLMCKISMSLGTIALFEERFLFFLYEFRPQPNAFKASLFPLLQQRCSSCNLILVKSKSFGPISPTPLLWLGTKTKMKPVGKHILQQFLCEHISEHHRLLGDFHFFVN